MENTATQLAMQHNVVITKPGSNTDDVGLAAVQAGEAAGYIPQHEAVLFYTPLAKPGETTQVEFTAPEPGDYPFVCAFPGHYATMKGVMHSTP
jgi:azurin